MADETPPLKPKRLRDSSGRRITQIDRELAGANRAYGAAAFLSRIVELRRTGAGADPGTKIVRVDELEVDPAKHEVRLRGKDVVCTPTELRLLHHLVRNRGRVFNRAQLLDKAVGNDVIVIDRNIDVHVGTLRKKLEDYGARIVTIRGVGYKFTER